LAFLSLCGDARADGVDAGTPRRSSVAQDSEAWSLLLTLDIAVV